MSGGRTKLCNTGRDQVECGFALSASGWNTFTMNNFASVLLPLCIDIAFSEDKQASKEGAR
jgi:hypothetical protein